MKKIVIGLFSLLSVSSFANTPANCYTKAEQAAEASVESDYYDQDGFHAYECGLAHNKAVVICEVSASKGNGDATDVLRVVLNKTCSKVFNVQLISEE